MKISRQLKIVIFLVFLQYKSYIISSSNNFTKEDFTFVDFDILAEKDKFIIQRSFYEGDNQKVVEELICEKLQYNEKNIDLLRKIMPSDIKNNIVNYITDNNRTIIEGRIPKKKIINNQVLYYLTIRLSIPKEPKQNYFHIAMYVAGLDNSSTDWIEIEGIKDIFISDENKKKLKWISLSLLEEILKECIEKNENQNGSNDQLNGKKKQFDFKNYRWEIAGGLALLGALGLAYYKYGKQ